MNFPRNLQDILGNLTEICAELAQHEAGIAHEQAAHAVKLANDVTEFRQYQQQQADEEERKCQEHEQLKRELVQQDQNLADEIMKLETEHKQLVAHRTELFDQVDCINNRLTKLAETLGKLNDERNDLHKRWCNEVAAPANAGMSQADKVNAIASTRGVGPIAVKPAPQKKMSRREWVKALDGGWTDEQVNTIVRRIGDLMTGRVHQSCVFCFGLDYDGDTGPWTIKDLYQLGKDYGVPFPG